MFFHPQSSDRVSDRGPENIHRVVTDLNKEKREPFLMLWDLSGITEIVKQVRPYRKIFLGGYRHLIRGRTTTLPANHGIAGLRIGSFRETRFQTGRCPKCRVHFYGCTGNVC